MAFPPARLDRPGQVLLVLGARRPGRLVSMAGCCSGGPWLAGWAPAAAVLAASRLSTGLTSSPPTSRQQPTPTSASAPPPPPRAGVNHAATNTSTYVNVALSDPLARRGLHAFEDSEMRGSAQELLAGGPHEQQAGSMFAVRFARNCTGEGGRGDGPGGEGCCLLLRGAGGLSPDAPIPAAFPRAGHYLHPNAALPQACPSARPSAPRTRRCCARCWRWRARTAARPPGWAPTPTSSSPSTRRC